MRRTGSDKGLGTLAFRGPAGATVFQLDTSTATTKAPALVPNVLLCVLRCSVYSMGFNSFTPP